MYIITKRRKRINEDHRQPFISYIIQKRPELVFPIINSLCSRRERIHITTMNVKKLRQCILFLPICLLMLLRDYHNILCCAFVTNKKTFFFLQFTYSKFRCRITGTYIIQQYVFTIKVVFSRSPC